MPQVQNNEPTGCWSFFTGRTSSVKRERKEQERQRVAAIMQGVLEGAQLPHRNQEIDIVNMMNNRIMPKVGKKTTEYFTVMKIEKNEMPREKRPSEPLLNQLDGTIAVVRDMLLETGCFHLKVSKAGFMSSGYTLKARYIPKGYVSLPPIQ